MVTAIGCGQKLLNVLGPPVLPEFGVTFQCCCRYIGFLPNFHHAFPITMELVGPREK